MKISLGSLGSLGTFANEGGVMESVKTKVSDNPRGYVDDEGTHCQVCGTWLRYGSCEYIRFSYLDIGMCWNGVCDALVDSLRVDYSRSKRGRLNSRARVLQLIRTYREHQAEGKEFVASEFTHGQRGPICAVCDQAIAKGQRWPVVYGMDVHDQDECRGLVYTLERDYSKSRRGRRRGLYELKRLIRQYKRWRTAYQLLLRI